AGFAWVPSTPERVVIAAWTSASLLIETTAIADDRFRAETPGGLFEAGSLSELGDLLRDFLANLEGESASDLRELARLSRAATDQATMLELARTSPPPDAWFG